MALVIRMVLYAVSAFLSGYGFASFDSSQGLLTINVDQLAVILAGGLVFVATFIGSRIAKARGGKT